MLDQYYYFTMVVFINHVLVDMVENELELKSQVHVTPV